MPNNDKLPLTHHLSGAMSGVEVEIDEDGEPLHESSGDMRLDPTSYARRIPSAGNPDDEGCSDREGERSFKGLTATTPLNRLNSHSVCGGDADFRSSLHNLFSGDFSDEDFR